MGIAADLSYVHRKPNPLHRLMRTIASSKPGAWLFSKALRHLDDLVGRLSGGRTTVAELLAGLPVLDVTTTGRKSGQRRTSHLISIPYRDTLALLGTNFGQKSTPAWVFNLEADPYAEVAYRGATREVVARLASESEAAEVFDASRSIYGGYAKYQERISGREVRVFILEPARPGPEPGR
ncbi:nitroreductase family deazaflavin-dependent oxidoreductase [Nocardioides sp.]|uniref:nitroreductase family deazaflavin-dependent oxidoreductase n=1 Tax=Nocardioides sp. TaxID=35761 RepID=UPI00356AB955